MRPCGRPTKSGRPCKQTIGGDDVACRVHTTAHEAEVVAARREGHRLGYEEGHAAGEESAKLNAEYETRRRVEEQLRERTCVHMRTRDYRGQLVQIALDDGGRPYTYRWTGDANLAVGDAVMVVGAWWLPERERHHQRGTVCALSTDYTGDIADIVARAK